MIEVMARFETENASKYLQQMCKHFAHKVPAEWTTEAGQVSFTSGVARFEARDGALMLICASPSAEQVAMLVKVVEVHLERFAFREPMQLIWLQDGKPADDLNARLRAMPDPHGEKGEDPEEAGDDLPPTVH